MDSVEIPIAARHTTETRQILTPSKPIAAEGHLAVGGWVIQVIGDAVFISCEGEVMTQTRTGQLNQKEAIIRRDPPAHSRGTETLK